MGAFMIVAVPVEFGANGLRYRQIKRGGSVTLYSVSNKTGKVYGYEVAILRVQEAEMIMGKIYSKREVYPSNENFGTSGWYFPKSCLQEAQAKFERLLESIPDPTLRKA